MQHMDERSLQALGEYLTATGAKPSGTDNAAHIRVTNMEDFCV
jgi:hypothetical protein